MSTTDGSGVIRGEETIVGPGVCGGGESVLSLVGHSHICQAQKGSATENGARHGFPGLYGTRAHTLRERGRRARKHVAELKKGLDKGVKPVRACVAKLKHSVHVISRVRVLLPN